MRDFSLERGRSAPGALDKQHLAAGGTHQSEARGTNSVSAAGDWMFRQSVVISTAKNSHISSHVVKYTIAEVRLDVLC